jgi:hypothetical protein
MEKVPWSILSIMNIGWYSSDAELWPISFSTDMHLKVSCVSVLKFRICFLKTIRLLDRLKMSLINFWSDHVIKTILSSADLFLKSTDFLRYWLYLFEKSFFTRFSKSLYQVCDICSTGWITSIYQPYVCFFPDLFFRTFFIFRSSFSFLFYVPGLSCRKRNPCHFLLMENR